MKCNNKSGYFNRNGYTEKQKLLIFSFMCVPFRIALGLIIWFVSQIDKEAEQTIASLVLIFSLIGIINNFRCLQDKTVWWSRPFHLISSIAMFIVSSFVLDDKVDGKWLAILLWIDVSIGVLTRGLLF